MTAARTPDYRELARIHGFEIPETEIEHLQQILTPLVEECRESYSKDLSLVEPIGTFRVEAPPARG